MKIYIAASSKEIDRACRIMQSLRAMGHEITEDWTERMRRVGVPDAEVSFEILNEARIANEEGILACDAFVFLAGPASFGTGYETCYALQDDLARRDAGFPCKLLVLVGAVTNCFHTVFDYVYAGDDELLSAARLW